MQFRCLQPNAVVPIILGVAASREDYLWYLVLLLVVGMLTGASFAVLGVFSKSVHYLAFGRLITGMATGVATLI